MTSVEKVMNIKVVKLIKIYNFYFGHCFIQQSGSNIVHKLTYLLYIFINYVRDLWICEQCMPPLYRMKK
jgi:hypothetical protein